jgi:hypothetical protein
LRWSRFDNYYFNAQKESAMNRTALKIIGIGIAMLSFCNCGMQDLEKELALLVNQMTSDKTLMESLAQDIKKAYTESDPAYEAAKTAYTNARSAYEGYLAAVRASAKLDRDSRALEQITDDTQKKTSAFVVTAVRALTKDRDLRQLVAEDSLLTLPKKPMTELRKLPKQYRIQAIDELQRQILWRGWEEL